MDLRKMEWKRLGVGLSLGALLMAPAGTVLGHGGEDHDHADEAVGEKEKPAGGMLEAAAQEAAGAQTRFDELQTAMQRRPRSQQEFQELLVELTGLGEAFVKDFPEAQQTADVRFQLCQWYSRQNEHEKLLKTAEAFLEAHPDHEQVDSVKLMKGMALLQTGDADKGVAALETMTGEEVDANVRWQAHFLLGQHWMENEQFDKARTSYKAAKEGANNPRVVGMLDRQLSNLEVIGKPPKEFSVTGTGGEELSPSKFKGKVLLIDFWAVWCGPCIAELPNVKEVYSEYNDDGFEILGISLDQDRQKLDDFVEKEEMTWPQFFDGKGWQNEIAQLYGVKSIPATYLLDKKGNVRYVGLRGDALGEAVEKLLKEKMEN